MRSARLGKVGSRWRGYLPLTVLVGHLACMRASGPPAPTPAGTPQEDAPATSCPAPPSLPANHREQLQALLDVARPHTDHAWRDPKPYRGSGLVGYIEIPRGSRLKFEFDIASNRLKLDRTLDESVGGYPVKLRVRAGHARA